MHDRLHQPCLKTWSLFSTFLVKANKKRRSKPTETVKAGQDRVHSSGSENLPAVMYSYPHAQTSTYILPCFPGHGQEVTENTQLHYPQRPKPPPGIFAFARLIFLDSRVSRCYGCGQPLKPEGVPQAPDDLIVTTRPNRKFYKEGRQHVSPDVSSVYCHVSN